MPYRRGLRAVLLVTYGQAHDVEFVGAGADGDGWRAGGGPGTAGATPAAGWDAWVRRGRDRRLGHLDRSAVTTAVRRARRAEPGGEVDRHRHTALSLLGMGRAELRRLYRPRRRAVTIPAPSVDRLIPLRRIKTADQRPLGCPVQLPAGSRPNAPTHATVASSLPHDVQEVRGVVLHSGPPATPGQAADRGGCHLTPEPAGADEGAR